MNTSTPPESGLISDSIASVWQRLTCPSDNPVVPAPTAIDNQQTDHNSPSTSPILTASTEDESYLRFGSRISPRNKILLDRVAYWMPGRGAKIQKIFNEVLGDWLEQHPDARRSIPGE